MSTSLEDLEDIEEIEGVKKVEDIQRVPELDLDLIFEDTDYSFGKCKAILDRIHFSDINRFSGLLESMASSKATISKYLNGLKDAGLLEKNVNEDRTVKWRLTEKGEMVVLYHVYFYVPADINDPLDFVKNKEKEIREYALRRDFDQKMTSLNLKEVEEEFDYFHNGHETDPLKSFLKTFLKADMDNYTYAVTKKED